VKKRIQSFSFLATVAMLFGMISWGGLLYAQNPGTQQPSSQQPSDQQAPPQSQQPPDQQTQPNQPPDHSAQTDANGTQEFVGTVVKQGNKYMFQDAASGATYDIDHQDEVKKFEGKKVRVHGTLDPNTKMIHVQ
jgi:uncharacterized protein YdeI (BOF family)